MKNKIPKAVKLVIRAQQCPCTQCHEDISVTNYASVKQLLDCCESRLFQHLIPDEAITVKGYMQIDEDCLTKEYFVLSCELDQDNDRWGDIKKHDIDLSKPDDTYGFKNLQRELQFSETKL